MVAERFSQQLSEQLLKDEEQEAATLEDGLSLGAGTTWKEDYYSAKFGRGSSPAEAVGATDGMFV
jgi:hypothetical protein